MKTIKIVITPAMYERIASAVMDAVREKEFFRGSIVDDSWRLDCSLLIYRRTVDYPEGSFNEISNIDPFCYNFTLYNDANEPVDTDFTFAELKKYFDYY